MNGRDAGTEERAVGPLIPCLQVQRPVPREGGCPAQGPTQGEASSPLKVLPTLPCPPLCHLEFFLVSKVFSSVFSHEEEGNRNEGVGSSHTLSLVHTLDSSSVVRGSILRPREGSRGQPDSTPKAINKVSPELSRSTGERLRASCSPASQEFQPRRLTAPQRACFHLPGPSRALAVGLRF